MVLLLMSARRRGRCDESLDSAVGRRAALTRQERRGCPAGDHGWSLHPTWMRWTRQSPGCWRPRASERCYGAAKRWASESPVCCQPRWGWSWRQACFPSGMCRPIVPPRGGRRRELRGHALPPLAVLASTHGGARPKCGGCRRHPNRCRAQRPMKTFSPHCRAQTPAAPQPMPQLAGGNGRSRRLRRAWQGRWSRHSLRPYHALVSRGSPPSRRVDRNLPRPSDVLLSDTPPAALSWQPGQPSIRPAPSFCGHWK
jgi:hypothetical protein